LEEETKKGKEAGGELRSFSADSVQDVFGKTGQHRTRGTASQKLRNKKQKQEDGPEKDGMALKCRSRPGA
jgi:hypothetical protein